VDWVSDYNVTIVSAQHRAIHTMTVINSSITVVYYNSFNTVFTQRAHILFVYTVHTACLVRCHCIHSRGAAAAIKKQAVVVASDYLAANSKPLHTPVTKVVEGAETTAFKAFFTFWEPLKVKLLVNTVYTATTTSACDAIACTTQLYVRAVMLASSVRDGILRMHHH
jgi:hypothetical protein